MRFGLASVAALLVLSSCGLPGVGGPCTAQIDWVDFIQVGSAQYVAGQGGPTIQDGDMGPVFAHVKHQLSGNVCDPNYRPKDGDAAFLEPGTPIYQVNGHPPSQMLAARHDGRMVVYLVRAAT